ncbi:CHAT domain-containing protein [Flavobacterium piscinae]|uniref:CHAT domain-containing protein n=1 Tax=Flavobacterium piscinae TaxID=2506424 RepID=A0A4Q1KMY4_9FLAO|nr:CHAT domain-containing tetratricopeptide repeat protein [Flavobacterium piscinae]RXR30164.1 CHAT domain-containing protein [Flavobacterium piscinae]
MQKSKSFLSSLFLFFQIFQLFSQSKISETTADSLHFVNQYTESIRIRKSVIDQTKEFSVLERNKIKLKLSEYYLTHTWQEGLALLEKMKLRVANDSFLSDDYLIEFYGNYYHAIAYAEQDWEKSLEVAKELLNKIETTTLKTTLAKQTEVVYDIAYVYGELALPYEAISYYEKAKKLYEQQGLALTSEMALLYNNLGFEYSRLSNFKKCNDYYVLATTIWEKNASENANYLTTAYNNLIYNFIPYGEIKKAEFYLNKLKKVANQLPTTDEIAIHKVRLSILLNELKIQTFTDNISCVATHQKLFNYYKHIPKNDNFINYLSTANNVLLNFYIQNKKNQQAEKLAFETEHFLKENNYTEGLLVLYSHIVVLKRNKKEYRKALYYIDEALQLAGQTIKGNHAGLLVSKGIVLKEMGILAEAETYYQLAHKILDEEKSADIETLSYSTEIANFYLKKFEKNQEPATLQKSFLLYENCVKQFNSIYKNGLFNSKLIDYLDHVQEGLFRIAQYDFSKLETVLNAIEHTNSKYLWSNFIRNNTSKSLLELDENYTLLQNLNAEIVHYKSNIQKEKEKKPANLTKIKTFENTILELTSQIEQLQLKLLKSNANYSRLFESKYTTSDFISTLQADETLINYYPTKENVYVVVLTKEGVKQLTKIENKENLYQTVVAYRNALLSKKDLKQLNKELYDKLFKNITPHSNQLTIVCKGILSFLPFETLQVNNKFLVEQYAIHYASSLTLYAFQRDISTQKKFKLAVFHPNYENTTSSILPFAEREALFLKEKFNATYFSDNRATKTNFFKNTGSYSIYHLAMHAQVNNDNEDESKLIFGLENLYFSDLYAQKLPLDLLVLSACETGYGKNIEGEGIMSLSRAFTYSGVAATIHSLWQIPDKQGGEIMHFFYDYLAEGFSKSEALQLAKLKFLKSVKAEELKHPYYWSGFVLSGNPNALVSETNYLYYLFVAIVLLGLLFFYFFKFRK